MKIEEFSKPIPHVIIKDVLDEVDEKLVFEECIKLDKKFKLGEMSKDGTVDNKKDIKNSYDIRMDDEFTDRTKSFILKTFDKLLWNPDMQKVYKELRNPLFHILLSTTEDFA